MRLRSGVTEGMPYSLSRWTDLPAAKWAWFREALAAGEMVAVDPRDAVPYRWSLRPEDTLGMVFWTKNPSNLIQDRELLRPYRVQIHLTATGWEEVEKGAPGIQESARLLGEAAAVFGPENVIWRFSPVPMVPDVDARFLFLAEAAARAGIRRVFVAFLQENDLMPETRQKPEKLRILNFMGAATGNRFGTRILVCNDELGLLEAGGPVAANLRYGVCAAPGDFPGATPVDGCGCVTMADPFTINESCTMGCQYCYAADKTLADKKRNTTRYLPVVR